jgi:transcriptional regulator GlxA family with amidase domain
MHMKHITILAPNGRGNNLSSIAGAYKILTRANEHWAANGGRPKYTIEIAGTTSQVDYFDGLFCVKPHKHVSAVPQTNLIIIPSLNHNYKEAIADNRELIDWIAWQYKQGAEVATICTGAFLLAASGLLAGKSCSTHWSAADEFRTMFADVDLRLDQFITDEHGIYTNGGAYSFLNLILYLVEKYYDRKTALYCAKVFQIDISRNTQSDFIIFAGQKTHGDEIVKQAQTFIEQTLDEKISVEQLSSRFAVGRRNFDRRFVKATGNTPLEYAQRVKVEAAKSALENTRKTVNEVMYDVGYADVKAFREVFRKITGLSPMEYRRKYSKDAV